MCEFMGMRKGIEVRLGRGDRERLAAVIGSGNSPQKHVWRAQIVLLSGDGLGTMAIQRQTGKGKPTIWRWQARFERLDLALLIDRQHQRVLWRIDVEANNILNLGGKLGVVRQLKGAHS